jgi:membrane fusion protein (multidrug efflux system)
MFRGKKILLGMLLLSTALLGGCTAGSQIRAPDNRTIATASPLVVHVFDVQPSPHLADGDLLIPAALSVEDTAIVLAEREGRIVNLRGQEGTRVSKGDILAQFNDDDQRAQLRQAELEVSRLQVEEQQFEALVKLNRSELDRELLLASQGLSSKGDVERAQYKLDQSVHEHEKTRLSTESARARVEAVKLELQKSTVRAPIAGIVTRRYIALGTNVARNDKLYEVSRVSRLEIRFRLPQTARDTLAPGRVLNLSPVNSDTIIAKARIRRIDPIADATSNTFGYVADIIGRAGLMPGLAVNVHLPRDAGGVSFWVPRTAFNAGADLHNGASSTLFVIDGEKASSRTVVVATLEGDQVEVVAGLVKDDRVVLAPPAGLKDGDLIEVRRG